MSVKTYIVTVSTSTTALAVNENIIDIASCMLATNGLPGTFLTPVTGTPGSTQVQFTGSVATPSKAFTLSAAPATGSVLFISADPAAGNPLGY